MKKQILLIDIIRILLNFLHANKILKDNSPKLKNNKNTCNHCEFRNYRVHYHLDSMYKDENVKISIIFNNLQLI